MTEFYNYPSFYAVIPLFILLWLHFTRLVTFHQIGYISPNWLHFTKLVTFHQIGYISPNWLHFTKLVTHDLFTHASMNTMITYDM